MPSTAIQGSSTDIKERVLALFESEHKLPIEPRVVVTAIDGFVVAGTTGMSAWASKTTFDGKLLWKYSFDKLKGGRGGPPYGYAAPKFNGAAAMPDGSVWLVGSTYEGKSRLGLLTHIGTDGTVLSERAAQPSSLGADQTSLDNLVDCQAWGEGLVIAGSTQIKQSPPESHQNVGMNGEQASPWRPSFWILVIDSDGNPISESVIPTGRDRTLGDSRADITMLVIGSEIVVSGQTGGDTELLRLDLKSAKKHQKHYANSQLQFVRSNGLDDALQMFGSVRVDPGHAGPFQMTLVSLDADLNEQRRQTVPMAVVSNATYRLADHSLILFGAAVHTIGEQVTSQVTRLDQSLRSSQMLALARADLRDTGMIYAAAPYGTDGQFVLATLAVASGYPDHPVHLQDQPGFLRGAVLELISIH